MPRKIFDQANGAIHALRLAVEWSSFAFHQKSRVRRRPVAIIFRCERDTLFRIVNVATQHPGRRGFYPLAFLFARSAAVFDERYEVFYCFPTGKPVYEGLGCNSTEVMLRNSRIQ